MVRAGLIPALHEGLLSGAGSHWRTLVMRPGGDPYARLSKALVESTGTEERADARVAAFVESRIRRGPSGLLEVLTEDQFAGDSNCLLLVDQFEEIFRYRRKSGQADDADAFVNLLLASANPLRTAQGNGRKVHVVITMRSDFIGECAVFSGLPEAINESQFLTPRLTRRQYRDAIVEPARTVGVDLEGALINRLLNDMRDSQDQLPILQHALMRMWILAEPSDQGEGKRLTVADYEAVGGLSQALSKHCNEVLEGLNEKQQSIAEGMFRCLCERGSDQRDTRRPTRIREIEAATGASLEELGPVADAFRAPGRTFLMPPIDDRLDDDTVLDISHESLIRQWGTLNDWVSAEEESAEIYTRLEREARSWAESGRQPGALWRTPNLDMALQWVADERPTEAWTRRYGTDFELAKEFLRSSEQQREEEEQKADKARQRELGNARALAEAQAAKARQQKQLAEQQKALAEEQKKLSEEQRLRADQQEIQAEQKAKLAKRLKIMFMVTAIAFVIALAGGLWAINAEKATRDALEESKQQTQKAEKRLARYFGNESRANREKNPVLSLLLAVEAMAASPILAAEEALREALMNTGGTPLHGHEGPIWSVAYSPDGKQLASGSADNTVRLWNMQTSELLTPACKRAGRNMTYREWYTYLGEETYNKVCDDLPYDQSFIEKGRELARKGDFTQALVFFSKTLILDAAPDLDVDAEARKLVAPALLDRGLELAKQGQIEATIKAYSQAQEFDNALQIPAKYWNQMCWWGSLWGHAAKIMHACENAVSLEPQNGGYRDSRGVARALTGDFAGAIADFKSFLSWIQEQPEDSIIERESWIKALQEGHNPFDAETLEALKTE